MAGRKIIDWSTHSEKIESLYESGLSVRQVIESISKEFGVTYNSGTLTNYLGRKGKLRSKSEAHTVRRLNCKKVCESCSEEYAPASYRQRWCDVCTGTGKYRKRLTAYGLSAPTLELMLKRQNYSCKVCEKQFPEGFSADRRKTLYIDHDHVTGLVRGLVCPKCNNGLSYLDRPDWLSSALKYIECSNNVVDEKTIHVKHHRIIADDQI